MAIFDVTNVPGRSLSSQLHDLKRLHLSFLNPPVVVLCAYPCSCYAQLTGSTDLYECSVCDLCSLRIFHLAILSCEDFHLHVHLDSLFSGIDSSGFLYSSPRKVFFRVHTNAGRFVIWPHFEVLCAWSMKMRQNGVESIDVVPSRSKSPDSNASLMSLVEIPAFLGV